MLRKAIQPTSTEKEHTKNCASVYLIFRTMTSDEAYRPEAAHFASDTWDCSTASHIRISALCRKMTPSDEVRLSGTGNVQGIKP